MQFQDELAGGVTLIRPALQSPDYVTAVSGWSIKVDGSAEFSNVVIRGGGTADPIVVGNAGSPQVIIRTSAGNGLIVFPTNRVIELNASTVGSAVVNPGAVNERAELQLTGPTVTGATSGVRLVLQSQPQNGTDVSRFSVQSRDGTSTYFAVDNTEVHIPFIKVEVERGSAGLPTYRAYVTGDSIIRWNVRADGTLDWGSGAAAFDVSLSRTAAGVLTVGGDFTVTGVGQVQHARRATDLARATNVVSDDPELQFPVVANAVYALVGWVKYSALENVDITLDWSAPAGSLGEWTGHGQGLSTTAQTTNGYLIRTETTDVTASRSFAGTTATAGTFSVLIMGTLRTGANAGTYALQWAQQLLDAANVTTVYADSWLRLERIA